MTHAEVEGENEETELPNLQALLQTYAKMLRENRLQFVETLFRAVKLDKLEVLRILCKIVQRVGLTLSDYQLREPESSATILHVALLYNHASAVKHLLKLNDKKLLLATYETAEYK